MAQRIPGPVGDVLRLAVTVAIIVTGVRILYRPGGATSARSGVARARGAGAALRPGRDVAVLDLLATTRSLAVGPSFILRVGVFS
jgi:hypothetical protein